MKNVCQTHFAEVYQQLRSHNNIRLPQIAFETGTHIGYTTYYMSHHFKSVYTVEILESNTIEAQKTCDDRDNISFFTGHSPKVLETVLPTIFDPCLFWLDAHHSGDGTSFFNDYGVGGSALMDELITIKRHATNNNNVILIDDCEDFGTHNYPTMDQAKSMLLAINPKYQCIVWHIKRKVLAAFII